MNRTQKYAWFGLIVTCFPVLWFLCIGTLTNNLMATLVPIFVFLFAIPLALYFAIWKWNSKLDVVSDERDNMIKSKAVMASYISVWVMLALLTAAMKLASNYKGMAEVDIMIPAFMLIFVISIAVYSAAILIQYGRGGQSNE